ncbi:MAG: replicative DNA helicase [Pseudomonadota bacterium]
MSTDPSDDIPPYAAEPIPPSGDPDVDALRVPPHSIPAEQAVLGGLMLNNQAWEKIADQVVAEDFYRREHQLLFAAIRKLDEDDQPFDIVTLAEELERSNQLDDIGGMPYLGALANDTPDASNVPSYARIVREHSVTRQLIRVGNQIAESGYRPQGRRVNELLDLAESEVFRIAEQHARGRAGFKPVNTLLATAIDQIEERFSSGKELTGLASGFHDFDHKTLGLQDADLIIVAGRPSMGKTSFAMNIAEHVALSTELPVAIFSMEMPGEQLVLRMLSSLGRINQQAIRSGKLTDDDWPRITSAVNLLSRAKLFIDDTPALTPTELRARCRRLQREHKALGLVIIDYLQLMQGTDNKENRATELSTISRSLKAMAKELNVPVIALSQLNRSLEQRPNKRPVMSDLRESGAIEQDADLITFIYRDEVYNEDTQDKGKAEIIIGKQRNGPIGTVYLTFQGQYTRFDNFAQDPYGTSL